MHLCASQHVVPQETPKFAFIFADFRSIRSSTDHLVVPIGLRNRRSRPLLVRSRRGHRLGFRR